jgi:branched-chain amino acid transport system ATP-binding protein
MSGTIIQVRGLTKFFSGLRALNNVDFDVEEGEITAIIGPNGAGKTTLFNLIAGDERPSAGTIVFEGRDISRCAPDEICRMGISRTYQSVRPFMGLSVWNNVKLGRLYGRGPRVSPRAMEREIEDILEFLQLSGRRDRRAEELIPLERKRLEIARALATFPRILLLDELIAGLTPTETLGMMDTLRAINARGITVLLIEHVMKAVMGLSHHVVVLHHGEKIAAGEPEAIVRDAGVIRAYLGDARNS